MCPDSIAVRSVRENVPLENIKTLIALINKDAKFICITGGEPTLLKLGLFEIFDECKANLYNTQFVMLTNGRMLAETGDLSFKLGDVFHSTFSQIFESY